ncbi:hypothetical protein Anapl_02497 [Anas platyrhynchos]|uniref:Uncharacterized protein n=1 Tax=Anas platyrhynchos TaxID=8839 RepID=R0L503_ANAPL|nr:hypothetical protein Anapl_02497 [Anas platyrhynchos]
MRGRCNRETGTVTSLRTCVLAPKLKTTQSSGFASSRTEVKVQNTSECKLPVTEPAASTCPQVGPRNPTDLWLDGASCGSSPLTSKRSPPHTYEICAARGKHLSFQVSLKAFSVQAVTRPQKARQQYEPRGDAAQNSAGTAAYEQKLTTPQRLLMQHTNGKRGSCWHIPVSGALLHRPLLKTSGGRPRTTKKQYPDSPLTQTVAHSKKSLPEYPLIATRFHALLCACFITKSCSLHVQASWTLMGMQQKPSVSFYQSFVVHEQTATPSGGLTLSYKRVEHSPSQLPCPVEEGSALKFSQAPGSRLQWLNSEESRGPRAQAESLWKEVRRAEGQICQKSLPMFREKPVKVNVKAGPGHQEQMSPELQQRAHLWAVKPPRTKEWVLQSLRANHKPKTLAKSWRFEAEIRHLLFKTHRWQFVSRNTGGEERNAWVAAVSPQGEACCIPGCWEPGKRLPRAERGRQPSPRPAAGREWIKTCIKQRICSEQSYENRPAS